MSSSNMSIIVEKTRGRKVRKTTKNGGEVITERHTGRRKRKRHKEPKTLSKTACCCIQKVCTGDVRTASSRNLRNVEIGSKTSVHITCTLEKSREGKTQRTFVKGAPQLSQAEALRQLCLDVGLLKLLAQAFQHGIRGIVLILLVLLRTIDCISIRNGRAIIWENLRISLADVVPVLAATRAHLVLRLERTLAFRASPVDPHARATISLAGTRSVDNLLRLAVGRIVLVVVSRRLVGLLGLSRALLATSVIALVAKLLTSEIGAATMAGTVHTLADGLADEVVAASLARNRDAVGVITLALLVTDALPVRAELLGVGGLSGLSGDGRLGGGRSRLLGPLGTVNYVSNDSVSPVLGKHTGSGGTSCSACGCSCGTPSQGRR